MIVNQPQLNRREALGLLSAALAVGLAGPASAQAPPAAPAWTPPKPDRELFVPVRGGKVWVRVNGDLKGPKAPVLMAHGGPGGDHAAFLPGLQLAQERGVILWDQLDCGRSDHPQDHANWTVERFVSEVDAIRAALDLKQFHLHGHSWGGTLALEYAGRQPAGLRSVILQGPLVSTKSWIADANALVASMAPAERAALREGERTGERDTPAYRVATASFYRQFNGRGARPSYYAAYQRESPHTPSSLYRDMWGPTEFACDGLLKNYDGEWLLERITAPAMVLVGEYDEARPVTAKAFAKRIKGAEFREIAGAAHAIQFDRTAEWQATIGAWFRKWD